MSDKEQYRIICKQDAYQPYIPIFQQAFWLDCVAHDWDVILYYQEQKLIAALPFAIKGNLLTKRIYLPTLSFYQSILFFEHTENHQQITATLLQQLPRTIKAYFKLLPKYHHLQFDRFIPSAYTTQVIIANLQLSKHHQRLLAKAEKNNYSIQSSTTIQDSFQLIEQTFIRKKIKLSFTIETLQKLLLQSNSIYTISLLDCKDSHNNIVASILVVSDTQSTYYLLSGYNIKYKNSGAVVFLLYHCIKNAIQQHKQFNFCGSSQTTIQNFFKQFGSSDLIIPIWKQSFL